MKNYLNSLSSPLIASLLFLSACSARPVVKVGDIPTATLPSREEVSVAESFLGTHVDEQGYQVLDSGKEYQRVNSVISKLTKAAGFPAGSIPVHLVDAGDEVNAMAVNSASMVVYRALLAKVSSDDELAVVLSHEVGHILARHSQQEAEKAERARAVSVGSSILGAIASIATAAVGYQGASDLVGDVTRGSTKVIGYGAVVGQFDRDQEYEADHIGLMLMAKAGYDPAAAIAFWQRADEIFGHGSSSVGAFFSTHPSFGNRLDALKEALPVAQALRPTTTDKGKPHKI
ncbi:MAG: M48 family metallopeptidase [Oligoflexia bacterium]|nr:M48 family metallopeptidase [Oligoflexia bacterium]